MARLAATPKAKSGELILAKQASLREKMAADAELPIAKLDLGQARRLVRRYIELQVEINKMTELLATRQQEAYRLLTEQIPTLFDQVGVSELILDDNKIKVDTKIEAYVLKENTEKWHHWLRANDFGGLIKNEVKVTFGKGEDQRAMKLVEALLKKKYAVNQKEAVNYQTFQAFVREQVAKRDKGEKVPKFPPELVVTPIRMTDIKPLNKE